MLIIASIMEIAIKHFNQLTALELYRILQLRAMVFVVEQNCPYQDLDGKDLESYHQWIWDGEQVIAVTRIVPPGISYPDYVSIGRVVSHPTFRRTGVGRIIMKESILRCEELFPGRSIKISAQSYLIPFYASFGFNSVGEEYLEDFIPHQAMIRYSDAHGPHDE